MAYKKQKIHEQTRSIKHIHAENTVVIREKGAGSGKCEMMKGDHLYGDEWRLNFWWWAHWSIYRNRMLYTRNKYSINKPNVPSIKGKLENLSWVAIKTCSGFISPQITEVPVWLETWQTHTCYQSLMYDISPQKCPSEAFGRRKLGGLGGRSLRTRRLHMQRHRGRETTSKVANQEPAVQQREFQHGDGTGPWWPDSEVGIQHIHSGQPSRVEWNISSQKSFLPSTSCGWFSTNSLGRLPLDILLKYFTCILKHTTTFSSKSISIPIHQVRE